MSNDDLPKDPEVAALNGWDGDPSANRASTKGHFVPAAEGNDGRLSPEEVRARVDAFLDASPSHVIGGKSFEYDY